MFLFLLPSAVFEKLQVGLLDGRNRLSAEDPGTETTGQLPEPKSEPVVVTTQPSHPINPHPDIHPHPHLHPHPHRTGRDERVEAGARLLPPAGR